MSQPPPPVQQTAPPATGTAPDTAAAPADGPFRAIVGRILPLISPGIIAAVPGLAILFYYQIHIGNLPDFISQPGLLLISLFVSLTTTLLCITGLLCGAVASLWIYAPLVFLVRAYKKLHDPTVTPPVPSFRLLTRTGQILIFVACGLGILIGISILVTWLFAVPLPSLAWLLPTGLLSPLFTWAGNIFHSRFIRLLLAGIISSLIGTWLWSARRTAPPNAGQGPHTPWTLLNCPPATAGEWRLYGCMTGSLILFLALAARLVLEFSDEQKTLYWTALISCAAAIILPVLLWRGCRAIPTNTVEETFHIFPKDVWSAGMLVFASVLVSLSLILIAGTNFTDTGLIHLILFFLAAGFLLVIAINRIPRDRLKAISPLLLLLLPLLFLFPGSISTLAACRVGVLCEVVML
ncbi:hypothetical protein LOC54_08835 [Acetobacter sp. AN02]|uniref:hypothetical protein n=1 Tax=Acetobacter sp. AN02 TaxID=2894186 RepID=UPI0024343EE0|nr:hypothetical protein [Acetobacter sp. AN02]MDG6095206.1 hypothetical protein [Acetobacter sp. AN02]